MFSFIYLYDFSVESVLPGLFSPPSREDPRATPGLWLCPLWHHSSPNGNPQTFHLVEKQYLGKYFSMLIAQETLDANFTF